MSDIVNPRVESYYMHPKKLAWRLDKELLGPDQDQTSPDDSIASMLSERLKMVISSKHGDALQTSRLLSHQEAPLDFSTKTVVESPDSPRASAESNRPELFDLGDRVVSDRTGCLRVDPQPAPSQNGHRSLPSPVPESCNPNTQPQRRLDQHSPAPHRPSQTCNGFPERETSVIQNDMLHHPSARHHHDRTSPTATSTSESQRETSPCPGRYKGSILHEVLARSHRPPDGKLLSPQTVDSRISPPQRSPTPPYKPAMNSAMSPVSPDHQPPPGWPPVNTLLPGPNPLILPTFNMFNGLSAFPPAAMNPYVNGNLLSPTLDMRMPQTPNPADKKLGKPVRPFKALTNELLYGIPAMNPDVMASGGYFRDYVQTVTKGPGDINPKNGSGVQKETPPCSSEKTTSAISNTSPQAEVLGSGDSNCSFQDGSHTKLESAESTSGGGRKRGRTLPDSLKDDSYWERRKKNNEAAKRSRDARRQKEDLVAQQAWMYRDHSVKLQFQLKMLDEQNQRLQLQLRSATEQCRQLELQLVNEKDAARGRCGRCGSRTDYDEGGSA